MNLVREAVGWRDGRRRNKPGEGSCAVDSGELRSTKSIRGGSPFFPFARSFLASSFFPSIYLSFFLHLSCLPSFILACVSQ